MQFVVGRWWTGGISDIVLGGALSSGSSYVSSGASSGASSGVSSGASSSASSGQVRVHVIVRASGRQLGSVVHGSVRVHECIIICVSG